MGISYNPTIVRNGLVLCLDAGNRKSFDGRENLVAYSEYNSSNWTNYFTAGASITTGIEAPDGTATAVRFTCTNTTNALLRVSFPAFTPNGTDTYTTSFYVRKISGSGNAYTDLHDGVPSVNYSSQLVTNQWVRVTVTGVPTNASKSFIDLFSNQNTNYVLDFWGVQVEKNSVASEYTKTTGSTFSRGTTITDLSGNGNNGSLVGSISYSSLFGGVFLLPGATGSYITVSSPNLSSSDNTIMGASRYVNASNGGRIFSGNGNNWLLGHHGSNSDTHGDYYANGWVYNPSNTGGSIWRIYTGTGDTVTDTWKIYENASLVTSNSNGSQGPNGFSIGRYAPSNNEYSNSYVSFLLAYDRVLTDDEIKQNFNALRGRFGI